MNTAETPGAIQELTWFRSSYSGAEGGQCVEVANAIGAVHIRDSKVAAGPVLTVSPTRGQDSSDRPPTGRPEFLRNPVGPATHDRGRSHAYVRPPAVRLRRPRVRGRPETAPDTVL